MTTKTLDALIRVKTHLGRKGGDCCHMSVPFKELLDTCSAKMTHKRSHEDDEMCVLMKRSKKKIPEPERWRCVGWGN